MRKLWQWENSGLVWTGYIQTAEFYLNLFFIRGEVFGRAINVPFYVTLIHSFTDAGQPAWRSASLSNIQQDPPHCPPFSSKSSVPEECTSWDFIPSSSHSAPGSSCECDDRSEWPQRTPLDPPPRRRRCCCHPHNANKQERDPFLPTVTQTWNPTPPPSSPLRGESSTPSAAFHILSDWLMRGEEERRAVERLTLLIWFVKWYKSFQLSFYLTGYQGPLPPEPLEDRRFTHSWKISVCIMAETRTPWNSLTNVQRLESCLIALAKK